MSNPLTYTLAALAELIDRASWVQASINNGTPRPYRQPRLTLQQRAAADARARMERLERVDIAPGDSPDPMSFEALELRDEILAAGDRLAEDLASQLKITAPPPASWGSDPATYLQFVIEALPAAYELDHANAGRIDRMAERLVTKADILLGHVSDGQSLQALCPFCHGKSDQMPTGGDYTLKILTGKRGSVVGRTLIVCFGNCEPDGKASGYRWGSHPAWDLITEAGWLSDRIEEADAMRSNCCAWCQLPFPRRPGAGRPARYCSDEHRLAAHSASRARLRAVAA